MVETRFSFKTRVGNGDSYIDRRRVLYIYAYRGSRRNAGRHRAATLFASRCIFLQARTHDAAPRRSNDATHEIRGERRALFFASTHRRREGKARIRVCNTRCNRHFILCPSFVSSNCSFSFPLLSTKCFFVFFSFLIPLFLSRLDQFGNCSLNQLLSGWFEETLSSSFLQNFRIRYAYFIKYFSKTRFNHVRLLITQTLRDYSIGGGKKRTNLNLNFLNRNRRVSVINIPFTSRTSLRPTRFPKVLKLSKLNSVILNFREKSIKNSSIQITKNDRDPLWSIIGKKEERKKRSRLSIETSDYREQEKEKLDLNAILWIPLLDNDGEEAAGKTTEIAAFLIPYARVKLFSRSEKKEKKERKEDFFSLN